MTDKLKYLRKIRERCGVEFRKSFRCQDAEKNVHLIDGEAFCKKFIERLRTMGYYPSDDFDINVIRHKYKYAERHHIGKTYRWKYFYSTTFEIDDEIIDYLTRHNFIFKTPQQKKVDPAKTKEKEEIVSIEKWLREGNSKREIVQGLRFELETVEKEIEEKKRLKETSESNTLEYQKLNMQIADLKKERKWYKSCLLHLRVKMNPELAEKLATLPLSRLVNPIKCGYNYNETMAYIKEEIEKDYLQLDQLAKEMQEEENKKDTNLMYGYFARQKHHREKIERHNECIKVLESGELRALFEDITD